MSDTYTVLRMIRDHRHCLTTQQMRTLKGQALNGNGSEALKGLQKLLKRMGVQEDGCDTQ